jgi:hypothetical protein
MKQWGAEDEAGESAAWGAWSLGYCAIRARWVVSSEWSSVIFEIICSREFGPFKVAGGTSDIFEFLV